MQLQSYFRRELHVFNLHLDISSLTPFRQRVLGMLMNIPYGSTVTYQSLAEMSGSLRGARAVGGAMAANPVPIIIPCHRVIGSDGSLAGYSGGGGTSMKRFLLVMEGVDITGRVISD